LNCNNGETGCYHLDAVHDVDLGRCLVRGCKCKEFRK